MRPELVTLFGEDVEEGGYVRTPQLVFFCLRGGFLAQRMQGGLAVWADHCREQQIVEWFIFVNEAGSAARCERG